MARWQVGPHLGAAEAYRNGAYGWIDDVLAFRRPGTSAAGSAGHLS